MGVRNNVEISCDFVEKTTGVKCQVVVGWNQEDLKSGKVPVPEPAKTFISLNLNGVDLAFCGKPHAAKFFMPEGYEMKQKQVVSINSTPEKEAEAELDWKDEPLRAEIPDKEQPEVS